MAGATAFDQLKAGVHLIGAINGQIDAINGVEGLQRDAQFGRQHLPLKGGGDADDVAEAAVAQPGPHLLNHQGCGGA